MRLKLKTAPTVEPVTLDEAKLHCKVDGAADNALITALTTAAREIGEGETSRAFVTQTWRMILDTAAAEIEIPKPPIQNVVSIKAISIIESYVDADTLAGQPILLVAKTDNFAVDDTVVINRDGEREENVVILSIQEGISLTMTTNLVKAHTGLQGDLVEKYTLLSKTSYYVDASENSPGRVQLKSGCSWPDHRGFASFIVEFIAGYGDEGSDVPAEIRRGILALIFIFYENRGVKTVSPEDLRTLFGAKKIYIF